MLFVFLHGAEREFFYTTKNQICEKVKTMTIETYCSLVSSIMAFASAALWIIAARSRVPYDSQENKGGRFDTSITVDGDDFIKTTIKQGEWNRWAAYSAALAAFFQGISMALSLFK